MTLRPAVQAGIVYRVYRMQKMRYRSSEENHRYLFLVNQFQKGAADSGQKKRPDSSGRRTLSDI